MADDETSEDRTRRSRKWFLTLLITGIATLAAFAPPLLSMWLFGADEPLVILSGVEWVSVITLVCSGYFTSNVFQKKVEASRDVEHKRLNFRAEMSVNSSLSDAEDEGREF